LTNLDTIPHNTQPKAVQYTLVVLSILLFFFSIYLMGVSFQAIGKETVQSILGVASNPFIALFIGLLSTAILQSSSTITSMAVALVATGSLPLSSAIPIVLGANVGTTITSTIVSLSYITRSNEFRKATAAGTVHDIYNILIVILILPLELQYNILTNLSANLAGVIPQFNSTGTFAPFLTKSFEPLKSFFSDVLGPLVSIFLAIGLLYTSVKLFSNLLYRRFMLSKVNLGNTLFSNRYRAFGLGLIVTSLVQSSSLMTSLMVPLVATGKINLNRSFQFIIGANLGTTVTAFLAALFQSEAAMSLALAHFIFNLLGAFIFLLIPALHRFPIFLSEKLGFYTLKYRLLGFGYLLFTFFIIPFGLIFASNRLAEDQSDEATNAPKIENLQLALDDK
jgi:sodium-dependent phosphate cotransporter